MADDREAFVKSLDMENDHDRGKIRTMYAGRTAKVRARWPVDETLQGDIIRALKVALSRALVKDDPRAIRGCAATLAVIVGQNQKDDHHEDRMLAHADKMMMNAARIEAIDAHNNAPPTKKVGRDAIIELIKDPSMAPLLERYGELAPDPGETDGSRPG